VPEANHPADRRSDSVFSLAEGLPGILVVELLDGRILTGTAKAAYRIVFVEALNAELTNLVGGGPGPAAGDARQFRLRCVDYTMTWTGHSRCWLTALCSGHLDTAFDLISRINYTGKHGKRIVFHQRMAMELVDLAFELTDSRGNKKPRRGENRSD